jgi:hypothetical protein
MDMRPDRLYKELIRSSFVEFVRFAAPALYEQMDGDVLEFQDKELFTDIAVGETSVADIVVKAKVKDEESFFLVHVENQSTPQPEFSERMYRYFAKLYGKYHLPVYPIAVLSWERPKSKAPDMFRVALADLTVLEFRYRVIQLNRMDWRGYLRSDNPVASALMTRMNVARKDRPRVKLEALKNIGLLGLNPAAAQVASWFVDNTLPLDAGEQQEFDEHLDLEGMREKEAVMEMTTSWKREGLEEGREEGRGALAEAVLIFLQRQVGTLDAGREGRVRSLPLPALEQLSRALLEFHNLGHLDAWLAKV